MRIVLDTNILVSALVAARGAPAQILARCQMGELTLLLSPDLMAELARVLHYPALRKRLTYNDDQIARYLALLMEIGVMLTPLPGAPFVADDPDDDKFVALALAGGARYLVSGDDHLLRLGQVHAIAILKPATFLRLWQALRPDIGQA